jgi:hypothetical protein
VAPVTISKKEEIKEIVAVHENKVETDQPIAVRVPAEEVSKVSVFPEAPSLPKVNRVAVPKNTKSTVTDVVEKASLTPEKLKKTLTGPVEELEVMSLNTFRRYGNTGLERAQKILQKINILEKDSVTKKTLGITAWRKSPVYQLYLELGSTSLLKGQEITQMIADKKTAGQEVLTVEEFQAISDLNKLLRF